MSMSPRDDLDPGRTLPPSRPGTPADHGDRMEEAEILASIADGVTPVDSLDDDALDHLAGVTGADAIARAAAAGGSTAMSGTTNTGSTTSGSSRTIWYAAAAVLVALALGRMFLVTRTDAPETPRGAGPVSSTPPAATAAPAEAAAPQTAAPSSMTLDWAPPGKTPTGWTANATRALPRVLPDFGAAPAGGTLGASRGPNRYRPAQMATVIIRSDDGWGSGAFISADGWLLTNYHVVESAAQRAAAGGTVATLDVISPEIADDRLKPGQPRKARLYRADPVHDLALLKLDAAAPVPFFKLAATVEEGQDGVVVGSQGNGPAWWVRATVVSQIFDFPADLSQFAAGVASDRPSLDRNKLTVLLTDARVSGGDSGGPLVNDAGELIGLTFATPRNATSGSVGWHIALQHLKAFVASMPASPEGVPFDAWTAGLGEDVGFEARFVDGDRDGRIDGVQVDYGTQAEGGQPRVLARTTFIDFAQRATENAAVNRRLPSGLWGVEGRGAFQFNMFVTARADGLAAVGYANPQGVVDEIRIGRLREDNTEVVWRRGANGRWQAARPPAPQVLIDSARLGPENLGRFQAIASDQVRTGPAGRGANKREGGR